MIVTSKIVTHIIKPRLTIFLTKMGYSRLLLCVVWLTVIPVAVAAPLTVNGLFKDKAVVTIAGKTVVLKKGQTSPSGALLLESNSERAIIVINGEQRTYRLTTSASFKAKPAANRRKTLTITPNVGGMYTTAGSINGFPVRFIIDTGASLVSMNSNVAKQLGIDYKLIGKEDISYTASGIDKIYLVNLKRVRIGGIELTNVAGAVHEGRFPAVTLLGMSFLSHLDMQHEGRMMQLQKKY